MNDTFHSLLWVNKFRALRLIEDFPLLHNCLYRLRYQLRQSSHLDRLIQRDTDIVIEGFPRSANSFAVRAFNAAQAEPVKISTHFHSHAPIVLARRWNIPCMVLIRDPGSSVVSLRALEVQYERRAGARSTLGQKRIGLYLAWYRKFYSVAYQHRDDLVFSKFEDATENFAAVIQSVNEKYDRQFALFSHNESTVKKIFGQNNFHLSPSKEREAIKELFRQELNSDENRALLGECERIYQKILAYIENEAN